MKTIRIACTGASTLKLNELTQLQGNLKSLSEENYRKLKKVILEQGFSSPESVWVAPDGTNYILDGHQRFVVLKTLEMEGYQIPPIPVDFIEAKDKKEAFKKLLAIASQYGTFNKQGLYDYMQESSILLDDLKDNFIFPEVNLTIFEREYFTEYNEAGHNDA